MVSLVLFEAKLRANHAKIKENQGLLTARYIIGLAFNKDKNC